MQINTGYQWLFLLLLLWSPLSTSAEEKDPLVATVNNHEIPLSYVYQKIEELPLGDQIDLRQEIERFIESVIQEEMLFQYVLATRFQNEPELRETIKAKVLEYLIEKHVKSQIKVTDEAIQTYYEANLSQIRGEHVRARHIRLKTAQDCQEMRLKIQSEETFAEMARQHSQDRESGERGGDLGYFMIHFDNLGFEADLFTLPLHTLHSFQTSTGCHLVWITEHLKPDPPPLEEVRANIKSILERGQEIDRLQTFLEKVSKRVPVERFATPTE